MKVISVEFVGSFGYPNRLPREARPEVAIFGRSNVGKSSLINTLLERHGVARISKSPGKTRSANFFRVNGRFHIVDMPGYGYAKVSKAELARWTKIYDQYVSDDTRRNAFVQLLDIRHDPAQGDLDSVARLHAADRPFCLVFNKSDKLKASQIAGRIREMIRELDVDPGTAAVPFSSVTGQGRKELWTWIEEVLGL